MRRRWKFVLIDEFRDTDPVQWQVFERAFADSTTMVLIGDPKQAIYAFRGGDIVTYLAAADAARTTQTLGINWRSDKPLLDGLRSRAAGRDPRRPAHRRTPRRGAPRDVPPRGCGCAVPASCRTAKRARQGSEVQAPGGPVARSRHHGRGP
ncbi:UvrD-helicase domain-containing protein [Nocardioides sp. B-3]|uniref:UvrD-helicase domain-containing protein n=1 Tax=Nocardioides sp. B-3 TaxID=2895565 RepID=UPI0021521CA9|nr:UvrD-helicase domain-containing protein [Nocardioides sp. B-3]UUZ60934.1 UvrD-helicase domain-containing protein [Nocardioides sp. B-3]